MKNKITRREAIIKTTFASGAFVAGFGNLARSAESRSDPVTPLGTPRGMKGKESRVVWEHEPRAVKWDGTGMWWQDPNTDQAVVDSMLSQGLRNLTDEPTAREAWTALFRHFNAGAAHKPGERIAIKVNLNNVADPFDNNIDATQHTILAMLKSLLQDGGIPPQDIMVYDATINPKVVRGRIPRRIYDYCRGPGGKLHAVLWMSSHEDEGVIKAVHTGKILVYAKTEQDGNRCGTRIPTMVQTSKYIINMALLKGHCTAGVSLTAKNHYGTIDAGKDHKYIDPLSTEYGPIPRYSPLVDLVGSPELGGKTLLFMIDALYGALSVGGTPTRLAPRPFNGQYASSLLFSLDPVALDSVGLDIMADVYAHPEQPRKDEKVAARLPTANNYLREAALAHKAPSGTQYIQQGKRLHSLGVHERGDLSASQIAQRYKTIRLVYGPSLG